MLTFLDLETRRRIFEERLITHQYQWLHRTIEYKDTIYVFNLQRTPFRINLTKIRERIANPRSGGQDIFNLEQLPFVTGSDESDLSIDYWIGQSACLAGSRVIFFGGENQDDVLNNSVYVIAVFCRNLYSYELDLETSEFLERGLSGSIPCPR